MSVFLFFGLCTNIQISKAEVSSENSSNIKILSRTSILNPKLVSQVDNNFVISFEMGNKEGAQSNLKYGVRLIKKTENGQVLADEKIFPEAFNLGPNETITKEITYSAPSYLVGEYSIWLVIENSSGLNQGIGTIGKVQLSGDSQYTEIDVSSCYLSVSEDSLSKEYNLQQGVDVIADETLMINCSVSNKFDREISLMSQFETFKRSSFSDSIKVSYGVDSIVLAPKEESEFSFVVPKEELPQAYDVKLSFMDSGEIVSNFVLFHYVLGGSSGTIQSIQMDKDNYLKDDVAQIKLFWSGSADVFSDSRSGKTPADEMISFSLSIKNEKGEPCIESIDKRLEMGKNLVIIEASIMNECKSLNGEGILKDSTGKVLDKKVFNLTGGIENKDDLGTKDSLLLMFVFFILAIAILILVIIKVRANKKNNENDKEDEGDINKIILSIIISLFVGSSFFFMDGLKICNADQVQAYVEWHFPNKEAAIAQGRGDEWRGGIWDDSLFTVGLGKDSYKIGEDLDLLATNATHIGCGNGSSATVKVTKIDSESTSSGYLISEYGMRSGDYEFYGTTTLSQDLDPGEHIIYFEVVYHHHAYYFTETVPVKFTVSDAKSCTGAVFNSTICPNDDTDLTANTAKTLTTSCSSPDGSDPKCEVTCNTGYIKEGGICTLAPPTILNSALNVTSVATGRQPTASWASSNAVRCSLTSNTGYNNQSACNSLASCASVSLLIDENVLTETTYTLTCFNTVDSSVTVVKTPVSHMVFSANSNDVEVKFAGSGATTTPPVELEITSWNGYRGDIVFTADISELPESPGDETTNYYIFEPESLTFNDYYNNGVKSLLEIFASYRFTDEKEIEVCANGSNCITVNIDGSPITPIWQPF